MYNKFFIDLEEAKPYEMLAADIFDGIYYESDKNDEGIDVIVGDMLIDVKALRRPFIQKRDENYHYKDLLVEVGNGRGGSGWLNNESKKTTHYLFFTDCWGDGNVDWYNYFLVSREDLLEYYKNNRETLKPGSIKNGYTTTVKVPISEIENIIITRGHNDNYVGWKR